MMGTTPSPGPRLRVQPRATAGGRPDWYRITRNQTTDTSAAADGDSTAVLHLYGDIGGWWDGIQAATLVRELAGVDADHLHVHINSTGGSVYDGLAIYQALRNHKARITTFVDGLAASIASVIAMAGDKRYVAPHAELMVHDPWTFAAGSAADMRETADSLDRIADNLAALYASRAGGDADAWRLVMRDEAWYSAAEAVAAGLCHEVQPDEEKGAGDNASAHAGFDLSMFNHAGRAHAPAPPIPSAMTVARNSSDRPEPVLTAAQAAQLGATAGPLIVPAAEPDTPTTQEDTMSLSTSVLSRLGLADTADEAAVLAALDARDAQIESLTKQAADAQAVADEAAAKLADATAASEGAAAQVRAEMVKEVELLTSKVGELSAQIATTNAEKAATVKANVIGAALAAGKFEPVDRVQWEADYDEAPEAVTRVLDRIAPGTAVPVNAKGVTGPAEPVVDEAAEFAHLFAPTATRVEG